MLPVIFKSPLLATMYDESGVVEKSMFMSAGVNVRFSVIILNPRPASFRACCSCRSVEASILRCMAVPSSTSVSFIIMKSALSRSTDIFVLINAVSSFVFAFTSSLRFCALLLNSTSEIWFSWLAVSDMLSKWYLS